MTTRNEKAITESKKLVETAYNKLQDLLSTLETLDSHLYYEGVSEAETSKDKALFVNLREYVQDNAIFSLETAKKYIWWISEKLNKI